MTTKGSRATKPTKESKDFGQIVQLLGERIAVAVDASRRDGDIPDDRRGLVFPHDLIIRDATTPQAQLPTLSLGPGDLPESLDKLISVMGISDTEVGILLLSAVTAIDPRFEHFFIVLNNEVDTRGPMVSAALRLLGQDPANPIARALFDSQSPLRSLGLVQLHRPDHSLAAQILDAPERVVRHLLGDSSIDPAIVDFVSIVTNPLIPAKLLPQIDLSSLNDVGQELSSSFTLGMRSRPGTAGLAQAQHWLKAQGFPAVITYDCSVNAVIKDEISKQFLAVVREAALRGLPIVIDLRRSDTEFIRAVSDLAFKAMVPIVLIYAATMHGDSTRIRIVDLPMSTATQRETWWDHLDLGSTERNTLLRLEPEEINSRIQGAQSLFDAAPSSMTSLARRVDPTFQLNDVIVEESVSRGLSELLNRVRLRSTVLDEWDMRPGGIRGRGITALFAGPSGTGKTMAAEALAGVLGVPLFHVDLSSVVDKYIGETEKNLERIFSVAENADGVLLFDEADALFGKRSQVSDARDRHANIEVAFLLQRMESFDGLAILTSNLRSNLDAAFTRRLDCIVDFVEPTAVLREEIWQRCVQGRAAGVTPEQWQQLASLELTGGAIRSSVVSAAYQAASSETDIEFAHLLEGARSEWFKMGRLSFPL